VSYHLGMDVYIVYYPYVLSSCAEKSAVIDVNYFPRVTVSPTLACVLPFNVLYDPE
jgi:hypothetical protein